MLSFIIDLAREAGAVLRNGLDRPRELMFKSRADIVTDVDLASERLLVTSLRERFPDHAIIAEEGGGRETAAGYLWLVDPLDGTRSFVEHKGEFTVNIGLVHDGVPVLGVVYTPVEGDLYAAAGPGTAIHWHEGRRAHDHPISARLPPPEGLTVLSSRSHGSREKLEQYLAGKKVHQHRHCSSSLKFCLLACGGADIYPRFGPTSEWDTAAGHAILLAAGGSVVTPDGQPLRYAKPGFRNLYFIAMGWRE